MSNRLQGLIAATCTPLHLDASVNLDAIPGLVDYLEESGVSGIYIGGSTGEGMSLSSEERRSAAESFVRASRGRLTTIVHVGHNSLTEARDLANHARDVGADIISATAPSYYQVDDVQLLVESMAEIADGAPDLPFYYYHIPKLTGATIDMVDFLTYAKRSIKNLVGIKYTAPTVDEFQMCLELDGSRFDVVWGCDEMLLSALAVGARAAIGSTYNVAAPLYREIMVEFERGNLTRARQLQGTAVRSIRTLLRYPFLASLKYLLELAGNQCGPCRKPVASLTDEQRQQLLFELEPTGVLNWTNPARQLE